MDETIVISLGGSLIVPDQVDTEFLKEFKSLILSHVEKGKRFAIICGGGRTCRKYQNAAKEATETTNEDLDWIGIATNNLNAELLRVVFKDLAHTKVIYDLASPLPDSKIIIGGAYEPGHSSDMDAVLAANTLGAKKIINLSNADHVYDSDPRTNPNAKKFDQISWKEYRSIIPTEWTSGLHTPFDPIASKLAEENGIEVVIMNGRPIDNLVNYLNGEKFVGTTIS
ncbi:MAG TPA: UMP kinase [Candidatus Paceibacterota bacterium]